MVPRVVPDNSTVSHTSTPMLPVANPLTLMGGEESLVTGVIAVVLTGMLLAYLSLCCHVWGLHLRLLQLLKCVGSHTNTGSSQSTSTSLPLNGTQLTGPGGTAYSCTPPPRYSEAMDSLPSYSSALRRSVTMVGGPLHCRITVCSVSDNNLNNSVFVTNTPNSPHSDHDSSPNSIPPYTPLSHIPTQTTTSYTLPSSSANNQFTWKISKSTFPYPANNHGSFILTNNSPSEVTNLTPSNIMTHDASQHTVTSPAFPNTLTREGAGTENLCGARNLMQEVSGERVHHYRLEDQPHHSEDQPCHSEDQPHHSEDQPCHSEDQPHHSEDQPRQPNHTQPLNQEEERSLRLWVRDGDHGQHQLIYARRTPDDHYVAYWTFLSHDPDHTHLQVVVEGGSVNAAFLELLDNHGNKLAVMPLTVLPSGPDSTTTLVTALSTMSITASSLPPSVPTVTLTTSLPTQLMLPSPLSLTSMSSASSSFPPTTA